MLVEVEMKSREILSFLFIKAYFCFKKSNQQLNQQNLSTSMFNYLNLGQIFFDLYWSLTLHNSIAFIHLLFQTKASIPFQTQ